MVDKIRPLKIEEATNGTEIDFGPREANVNSDYIATKGLAFENSDLTLLYGNAGKMTFLDTEVPTITLKQILDRISNSASPGFSFGRSGNTTSGTWLLRVGQVPSNKTGVVVGVTSPILSTVQVGNEDVSTFTVEIYEHEGNAVNLTLLSTHNVVAARTATFSASAAITAGRQIAVYVSSGSCKNVGVDLIIRNSV